MYTIPRHMRSYGQYSTGYGHHINLFDKEWYTSKCKKQSVGILVDLKTF
jgi:hypothetical protein